MRKKTCYESRKLSCDQNAEETAFRKELTPSERQRHIVRLSKVLFKNEIASGSMRIDVSGEVNNFDVDRYGRLRLGSRIFSYCINSLKDGRVLLIRAISLFVIIKYLSKGMVYLSIRNLAAFAGTS